MLRRCIWLRLFCRKHLESELGIAEDGEVPQICPKCLKPLIVVASSKGLTAQALPTKLKPRPKHMGMNRASWRPSTGRPRKGK